MHAHTISRVGVPERGIKTITEKVVCVFRFDFLRPRSPKDYSCLLKTPTSSAKPSCKNNMTPWTPSFWSRYNVDSSDDEDVLQPKGSDVINEYNKGITQLSKAVNAEGPTPLEYQVFDWHRASKREKSESIERATEACNLVCSIIAPNDAEDLLQAITHAKQDSEQTTVSPDLVALMTAFAKAPTRNLKTQILSIYAYEYSMSTLKKVHQPYGEVTEWQIKRARHHARVNGPGAAVDKTFRHRVKLDMKKVDHFIDFVSRPYYHQDVAYGVRKLKLENGDTITMPNVVRTVTRSTMITQYLQHCNDESFEPLSRRTLFRILEVREASQRKSLQGLDNTAADGSAAFKTLRTIVESLEGVGVNRQQCQQIERNLDKGKQYLKTEYRVHCMDGDSQCADHCRPYALSDSHDKDFRVNCNHQHSVLCTDCELLKNTLRELEDLINRHSSNSYSEEDKQDHLHDFNQAEDKILRWKAHVLRSVNQEVAKQHVLQNLDDQSVLVVMDWAMKFTQTKFREKQSDWYGKRGLSWHISSAVKKDTKAKNHVAVTSYVHLLDSCNQDWYSVLSIAEDLFRNIRSNDSNVSKAYIRSDEAGCYHNNLLIASLKDIGNKVGLHVQQYDFSEPQHGKDICDRIICPLKSAIRTHCNEGNDIMSAVDMHQALNNHPVKGTTCSVVIINENVKKLEIECLKNFSCFHNFHYEAGGIRVWKAYGVGKGKLFKDDKIYKSHQETTQLQIAHKFSKPTSRASKERKDNDSGKEQKLQFECPEVQCNGMFSSLEELETHEQFGIHKRFLDGESVYSTLKREWGTSFGNITVQSSAQTAATHTTDPRCKDSLPSLQMGWALSAPRTASRFPPHVRAYLIRKFEIGETTGHPDQVSTDMRQARNTQGERLLVGMTGSPKIRSRAFFPVIQGHDAKPGTNASLYLSLRNKTTGTMKRKNF